MNKYHFALTGVFLNICCAGSGALAAQNLPQLGKDPIEEVVSALTAEEKVKLISSNGFLQPGNSGGIMTLGHVTYGVPRLGIPKIVFSDGPAGIHFSEKVKDEKPATAFPSATSLASSWDPQLLERVGYALGHEVKEYGIDILLAPGMNAHRHPLSGRAFEYFSEDPLLTGKLAAAYVTGVQQNGVGTSLKHFVANEQETYRNVLDTHITERALREIYLKSFKIAVRESAPWTVMTSLTLLNGVYASESPELLDTVLRQEWGFDGFVMTDWYGGKDAVAQVIAGNDLLTPGDSTKDITPGKENQEKMILEGLASGKLPMSKIDRNVTRYLKAVQKSQTFKGYEQSNEPDLNRNAKVAYDAAAESIILLKNDDDTLPLDDGASIALFGNASSSLIATGTGSGFVWLTKQNPVSEALREKNIEFNEDLIKAYKAHLKQYSETHPLKDHVDELFDPTPVAPEMEVSEETITAYAKKYDSAVITLGRIAGENRDGKPEEFELTDEERKLITSVSEIFHEHNKPVIVVMNTAAMIEIASWRELVDAILVPWLPGQEGGNVIADSIFGKINPSGRLATTYPVTLEQVPSNNNFPGTFYPERAEPGFMHHKYIPGDVVYEEDIYSGYRFYTTFDKTAAYPFGFGLSYSKFDYSNMAISNARITGLTEVSVTVTNSGKQAGKEVVQVYVASPESELPMPAKELRAFAKTRELAPGESQSLTLTLTPSDLASFDAARSAWVLSKGTYEVMISKDADTPVKQFNLNADRTRVIEKVNKVLTPVKTFQPLTK